MVAIPTPAISRTVCFKHGTNNWCRLRSSQASGRSQRSYTPGNHPSEPEESSANLEFVDSMAPSEHGNKNLPSTHSLPYSVDSSLAPPQPTMRNTVRSASSESADMPEDVDGALSDIDDESPKDVDEHVPHPAASTDDAIRAAESVPQEDTTISSVDLSNFTAVPDDEAGLKQLHQYDAIPVTASIVPGTTSTSSVESAAVKTNGNVAPASASAELTGPSTPAPASVEPADLVASASASAASASASSEAFANGSRPGVARDVVLANSLDLVSAAKALSQATMAAAQAVQKPTGVSASECYMRAYPVMLLEGFPAAVLCPLCCSWLCRPPINTDAAVVATDPDEEIEIPGYDFTVPLSFRQPLPLPTYNEVMAARRGANPST